MNLRLLRSLVCGGTLLVASVVSAQDFKEPTTIYTNDGVHGYMALQPNTKIRIERRVGKESEAGITVLGTETAQLSSFPDAPKVSISGAYSFVRTSVASSAGENESALSVSGEVRVSKRFSGAGEYIKLNRPDAQVFLFGPRVRANLGEVLPSSDFFKANKFDVFAHFLAGSVRSGNGDNDFAFSAGGGLDFTETGTGGVLIVRVAQVDYLRSPLWDGRLRLTNHAKISSGVVLALDKLF